MVHIFMTKTLQLPFHFDNVFSIKVKLTVKNCTWQHAWDIIIRPTMSLSFVKRVSSTFSYGRRKPKFNKLKVKIKYDSLPVDCQDEIWFDY